MASKWFSRKEKEMNKYERERINYDLLRFIVKQRHATVEEVANELGIKSRTASRLLKKRARSGGYIKRINHYEGSDQPCYWMQVRANDEYGEGYDRHHAQSRLPISRPSGKKPLKTSGIKEGDN